MKYSWPFLTKRKADFSNPTSSTSDCVVASEDEANIYSSDRTDTGRHAVLLDLDLKAELLPSSSKDHYHLYIETDASWEDYSRFLKAAEAVGIIDSKYLAHSMKRGYTSLRLPHIKKKSGESYGGGKY